MQELIVNIAPNLASKLPDFYKALGDTMLMVLWSGLISFVFGLLLGVVLTVTKPNGILENKVVYQILDKLVSLFRSIPFIILLTWVMPITRALVGTVLYVRGAIVPLVFGSVPFFTRQVESALAELDGGLIEAALSMGSSPLEIIFRVYLKESIAAIARGTTITIVSLLNLTAMAGVAGAGGLGDFAIRYGHDRNMADITNVTVLVLVLIVCVIEFVGGRIVKKNTPSVMQAVRKMFEDNAELHQKLEALIKEKIASFVETMGSELAVSSDEVTVRVAEVPFAGEHLRDVAFMLRPRLRNVAMVLGTKADGKVNLAVVLGDDVVARGLNASEIVREAAREIQGGGGGQPFFAMAGGKRPEGLDRAMEAAERLINTKLGR